MENVDLSELMDQVLPNQDCFYKKRLLEKLVQCDIVSVEDLGRVNYPALENKLCHDPSFTYGEMGNTLLLRKSIDHLSKTRQHSRSRSRHKTNRLPHRGQEKNRGGYTGIVIKKKKNRGGYNGRCNSVGSLGGQQNRRKEEKPALWAAVEKGDANAVAQLLLDGKDPNEKFHNWTPFMKAAEMNDVAILALLKTNGADMDDTNNKGRTAMSFAAAPSGNRKTACEALNHLLYWGADATKQCTKSSYTPEDYARLANRKDALAVFKSFADRGITISTS